MAKIDYQKVESLFDEGIMEYDKQVLFYLAHLAGGMGESQGGDPFELYRKSPKLLMSRLELDLRVLKKRDSKFLNRLEIEPEVLKDLFKRKHSLNEEDLEKIKQLFETIGKLKKEMRKKLLEEFTNEDLIEIERKKSKNRRFNLRESWLPLH